MASVTPLGVLFFLVAVAYASAEITFEDNELDSVVTTINKLLMVRSEAERQAKASTDGNYLPVRVSALEETVKELIPQMSENALQVRNSSIEAQLKSLQAFVEARAQEEDKQAIVQAVRSGYFKLADDKLFALSDFEKHIPSIVHEVYAYSESNFDRLLDWANQPSAAVRHEILKTLYQEIKTSSLQNPYRLVRLAGKMQSQILCGSDDIKKSAADIFAELSVPIKATAVKLLLQDLSPYGRENSTENRAVAAALYSLYPDLTESVMDDFVRALNKTIDPDIVLDYLFRQKTTAQAALGMKSLYWRLRETNRLNDKLILKLASLLSQVQNRPEFSTLSGDQQSCVAKMVTDLPDCARNIYFSHRVCLWNKQKEAYLEAASSLYDRDRRDIITRSNTSEPGDPAPVGAAWFIHEINGKILFKSSAFPNEYLYVAYIEPFNLSSMKYVFSWVPGRNTDTQSAFDVELQGNYCYLKSSHFKEYMYVSDFNPEIVVTWSSKAQVEMEKFLWQIRSC